MTATGIGLCAIDDGRLVVIDIRDTRSRSTIATDALWYSVYPNSGGTIVTAVTQAGLAIANLADRARETRLIEQPEGSQIMTAYQSGRTTYVIWTDSEGLLTRRPVGRRVA